VWRRASLPLAALALACVGSAGAAPSATQQLTLTMDDGVAISCGYQPPPAGGTGAAVMLFHGLGGDHRGLEPIANGLGAVGYATIACDARGQGASGGFFDLDGPRTVTDVRAQFAWLASRPGVDPARIGAWGISLGGGAVWNSTVAGVPWAAIETVETWTDLYSALVPNGLPKAGAILAFSAAIPARARTPELSALLADALAGRNLAALRKYAAPRSSLAGLGSVRTPAFVFQGRKDFAFDVDQGTTAFRALPEGPKRLYVGHFGHAPSTFPGPDVAYVLGQGLAWFDRWLKRVQAQVQPAVGLAPDPWTGTAAVSEELPRARPLRLTLRGAATIGANGKVVRTVRLPRGTLETFGAPRVRARVTGSFSHLVAVLENGRTLVSEGGTAVGRARRARWVSFRLISDAVRLRGRTLRLTLAGTSTAQSSANLLYPVPVAPGSRLRVGRVDLTLPVLRTPVSR
jgi:hypothetical protein